jgi:hypothetical protein
MDIFSNAGWLNSDSNVGYGALPMPQPRDHEITNLLNDWLQLNNLVRQVVTQQVKESQRFTLLAYSERMASFAVRTRDQQKIFLGLLALGIDGWNGDWRENVEILCLHYDAAVRIQVMPEQIFENVASILSLKASTAFSEFLRRSPEDKSLNSMGYSAGSDVDGFRYKRDW